MTHFAICNVFYSKTIFLVLLPSIIAAVEDPFYKIASEALLVLECLVKVLRPMDQVSEFNFQPYTAGVRF